MQRLGSLSIQCNWNIGVGFKNCANKIALFPPSMAIIIGFKLLTGRLGPETI